jgi:hypothetical protein
VYQIVLTSPGYKLRVHINRALKTRCKAIRAALRKYNEVAKELGRPQLDWKDITTYDSLAEFDLLNECREDIRQQPWALARNREAAIHHLRLERAKEERIRLNIEILRLVNWMHKEEKELALAIQCLQVEGSSLIIEANEMLALRHRQNAIHRGRIHKIYQLSCYTGVRDVMLGDAAGNGGIGINMEDERVDMELLNNAEEDDAAGDELDRLNNFLSDLTLADNL